MFKRHLAFVFRNKNLIYISKVREGTYRKTTQDREPFHPLLGDRTYSPRLPVVQGPSPLCGTRSVWCLDAESPLPPRGLKRQEAVQAHGVEGTGSHSPSGKGGHSLALSTIIQGPKGQVKMNEAVGQSDSTTFPTATGPHAQGKPR